MTGTAVISPCGIYRYRLTRKIPCVLRWVHPLTIIGLNPSVADATVDDPTIRREMAFAQAWQCTELIKVNLFALRSTDPKALKSHVDPVGPENDQHILAAVKQASLIGIVLCAWGAGGGLYDRDERVIDLLERAGYQLKCLGVTKDGFPRHPLYLRADTPLMDLP